jgi:hypothetical protein
MDGILNMHYLSCLIIILLLVPVTLPKLYVDVLIPSLDLPPRTGF